MRHPLVSVVIATYNDGAWLPETLQSALAQTYRPREIIVVDDGSTDDTASRIEPYLSQIRYVRRAHEGLAGARNAGIAMATGAFVALLDADDLWLPEKLTAQMAVALRHPESGLIACDGVAFTAERGDNGPLLNGRLRRLLLAARERELTGQYHHDVIDANPIVCPAQVLIPRRVLREVGPFSDSMVQDYDYYLRLSHRFALTLHRDVLVRYRERPDSMSGPVDRRLMVWGWDLLRALGEHAGRCGADGQRLLERHRRRYVRLMAYTAYADGLAGNRSWATRVLLRLLRDGRFTVASPYLVGLWTPGPLRRVTVGGYRALKQAARAVRRALAAARLGRAMPRGEPPGYVERWSPDLDEILPPGAMLEQVADGFEFAEGPVWIPDGHLLFADLPHNVIWKWHPAHGASVVRTRTGYAAADIPPGSPWAPTA